MAGRTTKQKPVAIAAENPLEKEKNEENKTDTKLDVRESASDLLINKEVVNYVDDHDSDTGSGRKIIIGAPQVDSKEIIKANEIIEHDFVKTVILQNSEMNSQSIMVQNDIGNETTENCSVINNDREVKEYKPIEADQIVEKTEGNIELENMAVESDNEENTLVVNLHNEEATNNNHNSEMTFPEMEEQIHFTAMEASTINLQPEMPSTVNSKVIVEPAVTFVVHNNGTFYLQNLADKHGEINLIPTNAGLKVVDKSTVAVSSEPDFHFISNIGIVKGQSLCYGKHEFKCLHCPFKTQWRNTLCLHMKEKHVALIGIDKQLEVNVPPHRDGGKILRMSEYIEMQKKKMKVKTVRGVETQDIPGDFPCNLCGKVYHRLRYLRCHMKRHNQSADLLCSECGKAFKTKAYLAQHLRSHREKEMYQCSQCEFSSDSNTLIHAHIQIHSDGCLICDICNAAFTDKTTLQRHKRVHDKNRPFGCKFDGCTMRFKTEMMCNGHYKQHFTKGKFECGVCGYVFRQKHHLLRHRKRIHNLNLIEDVSSSESHCNTNSSMDVHEHFDSPLKIDESVESNSMEASNATDHVIQPNEDEQFDLENALQRGELVVATDEDGNPVTYKMSDINVNVAYQTLLQATEGQELDPHTILIPQADANNVVFEDAIETVGT